MTLIHVPARQGETYVNPDHVVYARYEPEADVLRIGLTGQEYSLTVDGALWDVDVILAELGHAPATLDLTGPVPDRRRRRVTA